MAAGLLRVKSAITDRRYSVSQIRFIALPGYPAGQAEHL